MSLSLVQAPNILALAGNKIIFNILTNNRFSVIGLPTYSIFYPYQSFSDGQTFSITWTDTNDTEHTITYTYRINPVTELEFNTQNLLLQRLQSNIELCKDFAVTVAGFYLKITSHNNTNLQLDITGQINIFNTEQGSPETTREFFRIACEIYIVGESGLQLINTETLPPAADGTTSFDIAEYILREFSYCFADFLRNAPDSIDLLFNAVKQYRLRFFEQYGIPQEQTNYLNSIVYYALSGGITRRMLNIYNNQSTDFFTELLTHKRFLTLQPRTKITDIYASELLYYLSFDPDTTSLTFVIEISFTDNSRQTVNIGTHAVARFEVMQLRCGFTDLNLESYETTEKKVSNYIVHLSNQNNSIVSEYFRFNIDSKYYPNRKELIFKNSLGFYDSVRLIGETEINEKYERQFFEQLENTQQHESLTDEVIKTNTGWIIKEYRDYLQDLFLSDEIYELNTDDNYRIRIITEEIFRHRDNNFLYDCELEYIRTEKEKFFTAENIEIVSVAVVCEDIQISNPILGGTLEIIQRINNTTDEVITCEIEIDLGEGYYWMDAEDYELNPDFEYFTEIGNYQDTYIIYTMLTLIEQQNNPIDLGDISATAGSLIHYIIKVNAEVRQSGILNVMHDGTAAQVDQIDTVCFNSDTPINNTILAFTADISEDHLRLLVYLGDVSDIYTFHYNIVGNN